MPDLASGTYNANGDKSVTYWPAPDADGTGEEIWEDRYDDNGRSLGREKKKDRNGRPLKTYPLPDGFREMTDSENKRYYVKTNPDGTVYRNDAGEAVNIKPGQAIVEHVDGTVEVLEDEYARYRFGLSHDKISPSTSSRNNGSEVVPDDEDDDDDDEEDDTSVKRGETAVRDNDSSAKSPAKAAPAKVTPGTVAKR
jgi:hypothetical protein